MTMTQKTHMTHKPNTIRMPGTMTQRLPATLLFTLALFLSPNLNGVAEAANPKPSSSDAAPTTKLKTEVEIEVEDKKTKSTDPSDAKRRTYTPEQLKQIIGFKNDTTIVMRNVAYLGVATAPVSRELGVHLKLPNGFGLMVVHIEKDSPADKAGLKKDDVLHKLGDQLIVNTEQLGTLVRSHKKNDKVELTVIRKGETKQLAATLAEKKVTIFPKTQQLQMRAMQLQPRANANPFRIAPNLHMKWHDGTHELAITRKDNKKHLIAKDKNGKVLFDGPIETEEDRKAVPSEIKPKLEKLETSTKIRVFPSSVPRKGVVPGFHGNNVDHRRIMQTIDQHLSQLNRNPRIERDEKEADRRLVEMRKRIHDDLAKQLEGLQLDIEQSNARIAAAQQNAQRDGQSAAGNRLFGSSVATASFSDPEHSLILKVNQTSKHLVAKDKAGNVLFDGPVDNDAQRKALPANILAKLKTLEDSTKFSIRLNGRRLTP